VNKIGNWRLLLGMWQALLFMMALVKIPTFPERMRNFTLSSPEDQG
jgi:hypothetical protein